MQGPGWLISIIILHFNQKSPTDNSISLALFVGVIRTPYLLSSFRDCRKSYLKHFSSQTLVINEWFFSGFVLKNSFAK
jgi:hypothetical protein